MGFGGVKIAYPDKVLMDRLPRLIKMKPVVRIKEDLSSYELKKAENITPVTWENLKHNNLIWSINEAGRITCFPKPVDFVNARADQIIFSSQLTDISTDATFCKSTMFVCKKPRVIAAVHVSATHRDDLFFNKDLLLIGLVNIRKLVPTDPISAYISGMSFPSGPRYDRGAGKFIRENRTLILFEVQELLSRGVSIDVIDIGDLYEKQVYSPGTDEYKTVLFPPD